MENDIGKVVLVEWKEGFRLPQKKGKHCYVNLTNPDYVFQAIQFINDLRAGYEEYILEPSFGAILDHENQPNQKDQKKLEKAGFSVFYFSRNWNKLFFNAFTKRERERAVREYIEQRYKERTDPSSCRNQTNMYLR